MDWKLLAWYVKRPHRYPEFISRAKKQLFGRGHARQDTRREAEQWCAELAMDTDIAVEKLTGGPAPAKVDRLFADYLQEAESIVSRVPEDKRMGGAADLDLIYWVAEHLQATKVVETGVAYGWSSLVILLSLKNRRGQSPKLVSTDRPYPNRDNEQYVGCVVPAELRAMWRILKGADRQVLPIALRTLGESDMCHYDSDKSYDGRMWAYPLLWDALRPGGFFISDDIADNLAFYRFSKKVGCDPIVVKKPKGRYSGVIIRP